MKGGADVGFGRERSAERYGVSQINPSAFVFQYIA